MRISDWSSDVCSSDLLVTGGAGFIGSNIAARLAESGRDVIVYDSLARLGGERNLEWLQWRQGKRIMPVLGDLRDAPLLADAVKQASAVVHIAGQGAVTTSLGDSGQAEHGGGQK